jgi:sugar phosphate permease
MAENVLINPPNPTHQQHQQQQKPHHLVIPWSRILCNGPVWALGIAKFAYYYSFFMVVTWMPTYLGEMGMDEHTAAYASATPFAVTCPAIIFFGWLAYHLTNHMEWRLVVVRKTFGTISFLANIGCFFALLFLKAGPAGDSTNAWTALIVFIVMYALNAPFIAGVAVNVLDIAAKYAGSVMALTHEFATGAGFLASVITGALVTERGRYERAFMVAIGVNVISMVVFLLFGSVEPQCKWRDGLCGCVVVWMCGCVDVWMCGCVDVWMCGCVDVWMCGCVVVWMCGCVDVWMCGCVDVWLCARIAHGCHCH